MLDEELIKKEKERTRKLADTRQTEEIRRELQMRQNNQKPVESFLGTGTGFDKFLVQVVIYCVYPKMK